MTLLDDARQILKGGASGDDECPHCHTYIGMTVSGPNSPHRDDCPWLSMPKILAALEAAERIADLNPVNEEHVCTFCGDVLYSHEADCAHAALVAALAPDA